ncbi:glycosyltransferase family 2 protein [bacterium]|nr:glycosyltransferase family 2 protein [bacterium]
MITEVLRHVDHCVAVDDGSTDKTASVIQELKLPGLELLKHPRNLGKGRALITGFRHAMESYPELDSVITLDGDGQHDPSLIPNFIQKHEQENADLVYGNRMTDLRSMPLHRRWLNALSNKLVSGICKMRIYDSQCGFRLYSVKLLRLMLDELKSERYELETEILIRACKKGVNISWVPIPTIYSAETTALSNHSLSDVIRIGKLLKTLRRS